MLPRKILGQHFLKNPSLLEKLVSLSNVTHDSLVIEIGAGEGDLTKILITRAKKVYSYELDRELFTALEQKFSGARNLVLKNMDFLKEKIQPIYHAEGQRLKIVANIPYKITTPLILKLIKERKNIEDCHILVQKEVGKRIIAEPGMKEYSSLTVLVRAFFSAEILKIVRGKSFTPPPKVDSAFLRLKPLEVPFVKEEYEREFSRLIKIFFSQRRKTISNVIFSLTKDRERTEKIIQKLNVNPLSRPENFSVQEYAELCSLLL